MTLQEYTESLSSQQQLKLAVRLAKLALPIWSKYANENDLAYRDSVVGLTHSVDKKILQDTIESIEEYLSSNKFKKILNGKRKLMSIRSQFDDPIVALQDLDWELPDPIQKTFYSVYNLIDSLLGETQTAFGDSTIYVSINQAVDALDSSKILTSDDIKKIISDSTNGR